MYVSAQSTLPPPSRIGLPRQLSLISTYIHVHRANKLLPKTHRGCIITFIHRWAFTKRARSLSHCCTWNPTLTTSNHPLRSPWPSPLTQHVIMTVLHHLHHRHSQPTLHSAIRSWLRRRSVTRWWHFWCTLPRWTTSFRLQVQSSYVPARHSPCQHYISYAIMMPSCLPDHSHLVQPVCLHCAVYLEDCLAGCRLQHWHACRLARPWHCSMHLPHWQP